VGRAKEWFYTNKDHINTWARCSKAFLEKFFPLGKTNASRGKISSFQQQKGEWLLMQSFYHGLTQKSHEQLDATTKGSFMSLTLGKAKTLLEKIASNQGWSSCNIQSCNKSEEILEEVCALSTKMDVLLNWLEQQDNYKRDRQAIQDAFNAQNRCGEYLGVEFPESQEDINIVINNSAP
jgi:hypothetical protein